jgi:uncharacterized protein
VIEEKDVLIPVRDGARMAVRIYRPEGAGTFPALFATSPYRYDNNALPAYPLFLWRETGPIDWYVEQGYTYVHADVRGTGQSEGEFEFLGRHEQQDLYDLIEWIARQQWSNGRVGGIGQSYYAMSQWFMGIQNPPHLACIAPYDGLNDPYRFMGYPGGIEGSFLSYWVNSSVRVPNLYPANGEHPRHITLDLFSEVQRHPFYDDFWRERAAVEALDQIQVPVFSIGVWAKQDLHLAGNIAGYQFSRGPKKLAITATPTAFSSMVDFAKVEFHRKYLLPFYDQYLKGRKTSHEERPNVEYTVRNTGTTRSFDVWPPPGIRHSRFYLSKGPSGAVSSLNDGALEPEPPEAGGGSTIYAYPQASWVLGVVGVGPHGPDPVRAVLTFTSQPLGADLEIAGNAKLTLYAASTRNDMDFIVKLSEQFEQNPDEKTRNLSPRYAIVTKGWLRASHTELDPIRSTEEVPYYTHKNAIPLKPGTIYKVEVPLQPMAYRFKKGNRIRLEIANGDSPVTDGLFYHFYRPDKIGVDTIYHNAGHPSSLLLPMLKSD